MNSYCTGLFSEWIARQFLRCHGYRIIKVRYKTGNFTGRAEIDIIAKKKNLILFVEVKNRKDVLTGLDAITTAQHKRLRSAAEVYLRRYCGLAPARFDVIVVTRWHINWLQAAI